MNNVTVELKLVVDKLFHADNDYEAQRAMGQLKEALREEVSDRDRTDIHLELLNNLRAEVFSLAQEHYDAHPALYPDFVLSLLNAVPMLMGRCILPISFYDDTDLPKEVRHQMDELSHCRTPESVTDFLKEMMELLDEHPEYRQAGYSRLLRGVECEMIAAYAAAPDHFWRGDYLLSLLGAVEESVHFCYTLNFLSYEGGVFEMVTADTLMEESNLVRLSRKLEVFREAMSSVNPIFQESYLRQLTWDLPQAVLETLENAIDEDELPEYLVTLMDILEDVDCGEVLNASEDEEPGEGSELTHLLNAQAMLHALCVHRDPVYLENDWAEFLSGAAGCPCCTELINEQAHVALSTRILKELMAKVPGSLPEATLCLIRLLLAVTVSPITSTCAEEVWDWVLYGSCAAA